MKRGRPRLILLADRPNWAFDFVARSLRRRLARELDVRIDYSAHRPDLDRIGFDVLHVFFWADGWHRRFQVPRDRLIVEVASHRWSEEPYALDPGGLVDGYLAHCDTATTPSEDLRDTLLPHFPRIFLTPNGYEPSLFHEGRRRPSGRLRIAWAGRPEDSSKGLFDILLPACEGRFDLAWTDGTWSRAQVARLFRSSDVVAVASAAESQPLPLIEGMACGCFPVTTAVGIAPRLVDHGRNGLLVERNVDAFRDAFAWCEQNLDRLRSDRRSNARLMRLNRTWDRCAGTYRDVYRHVLRRCETASVEPPAELLRVSGAPVETGELRTPRPGRLRAAAESISWRLSDLGADLRRLRHVARRDGLLRLARGRLLSPRWYHRSLGLLLRRLRGS